MASTSKPGAHRHSCEYCKKEFARKSNLDSHRKIHLFKTEFKCSFCSYVTNFKNLLESHTRKHTRERHFKCKWPNCKESFIHNAERDTHYKTLHRKDDKSLKKFKCSLCTYNTVIGWRLKEHLKSHSDVKPFSCELCPHRSKTLSLMKSHQRDVHLNLKPFKCQHPNCDSAFNQKSVLQRHSFVHKKGDESLLIYKCPDCNYKTISQKILDQHLEVHAGVKRFSCNLCSFRSNYKRNVAAHIKSIHSDKTPFKCPESNCSFSTKRKSSLKGHMKVHTNYKEFACNFPNCIFRSKYKRHLKTHELTHSGEKPFKCTFCSYKTIRHGDLSTHIRRQHTREAPYPCPTCPYRGKTSGDVKLHVKNHHKQKK